MPNSAKPSATQLPGLGKLEPPAMPSALRAKTTKNSAAKTAAKRRSEKQNGQELEQYVQLLLRAKEAYYNGSEPLLSDEEFDRLEDELRRRAPEAPYFALVGHDTRTATEKVRHQVPMLSMDKAKQLAGVEAWFLRLLDNCPLLSRDTALCVQPKIDGISASCYYRNGRLQYVATRGDGRQGQNISHIAPIVADIPELLGISSETKSAVPAQLEVRGELYLPRDTDLARKAEGRPLRNICAGLINRKEQILSGAESIEASQPELRQLRFIAYQCPQQRLHPSEYRQLTQLTGLGFHSVAAKLCQLNELSDYVRHYLEQLRRQWLYETDGLIICLDDSALFEPVDALWVVSHHHHYAIALKPPAESGTSILRQVHWQLGRLGRLSPVAEFLPLRLASAVIERANLHNYANILRQDIQRGDVLKIERVGDVIPYVRQNLGRLDQLFQANWNAGLDCRYPAGPSEPTGLPEPAEAPSGKKTDPEAGERWEAEPLPTESTVPIKAALELVTRWLEQEGRSIVPGCCPSCGGPIEEQGVDLYCPNRDCPEQVVQRILFWVRQAGMEQVAEQSIRQLYREGKLRRLQDLYNLTEQDLRQMPGYAEKKIAKFLSELEASRKLNIQELVERLGIPLLQQKSVQKLGELRRKSRWDRCLETTFELWHQTSVEEEQSPEQPLATLETALAEALPGILPDWSGWLSGQEPHAAVPQGQLAGDYARQLLEALCQSEAITAVKLPRLWGTKTGRSELWKTGAEAWQNLLLARHPGYLELLRPEDFCHFIEPESRYSVIDKLSEWLAQEENQLLLKELLPVLKVRPVTAKFAPGQTICMTGSGPLPRKQLQEQLESKGYKVSFSLSRTTDILLCANPNANSSKLRKAAEWGIAVYSYDEFLQGPGS